VPNLGPGLHSGSALGVGISAGGSPPPAAGPAEPNPNLLLWSEQLQQGAWVKTFATITADDHLNPDGSAVTADAVAFLPITGKLEQTTSVTATVGAAVSLNVTLSDTFARKSLSGTFDGAEYVFSFSVLDNGSGADIQARLERSGGFLMGSLRDTGDGATFWAWGFKLETPDLTAYVMREGT
jgi:hypothetical protein